MVRTVRFTTRLHELVGHLERCAAIFSLDSPRVQFLCREGTELKRCRIFKSIPQHTTTVAFGTSTMATEFGIGDFFDEVSVLSIYSFLLGSEFSIRMFCPLPLLPRISLKTSLYRSWLPHCPTSHIRTNFSRTYPAYSRAGKQKSR